MRSGKYVQGNGALLDKEGRYCCLGVLSVVAGFERDILLGNYPELEDMKAIGLSSNDPAIEPMAKGSQILNCLSDANDAGIPFAQIADIIEAQL